MERSWKCFTNTGNGSASLITSNHSVALQHLSKSEVRNSGDNRSNVYYLLALQKFIVTSNHYCIVHHDIQIKICAEYRDMLPRPRLVCQEPGLRPIGRSPGVPDKSSRGLGSMSRYSAQILICFIAYIFSIFNFSVGLVGNLAELPPCTVPPATVHCYQNEAAQCSSDNQISQHALLRGSRKKHSLAFMPQNWWN